MDHTVLIAFGLTLFAGLSTGIGSLLALVSKKTDTKFLSVALGFSAGIMLYVSFVDIFPQARDMLVGEQGTIAGSWITVLAFFGGIGAIALIDMLIPSYENPHEVHKVEEMEVKEGEQRKDAAQYRKLMRTGVLVAFVIAIHNFPEGLVTFTAALKDVSLGIPIAIAIAIHNIPEGIAVAVPLFYATGNRRKACLYSFLSGLAEPLGALVGYLILWPVLTPTIFGILFAGVGGIMVFISLDELLPAAQEYGHHHLTVYGMVAGMAVMAVSLLLFI
ncbi:zinc transporter ZupT [Candidatus Woesearchaeota archaeon CG_4_10_14_0_8_um_filter_47_5]|nr:MAG: zinc transporter ZupT [Candidatus Woesearchaeota archaeon CG_4_10_14_0_8_um_filter_47_5]